MKIAMFAHFKQYHGNHKILRVCMILGDAVSHNSIRDVCIDFEPYFKVHNSVSVRSKSNILGQMTNQFIDWLKFETRPSPLLNFGTANLGVERSGFLVKR